jgi:hypothetical protein
MKTRSHVLVAVVAFVSLGAGFLIAPSGSSAPGTTDYRGPLQKLADAIRGNNNAEIKRLAEELAGKTEVAGVMNTLERRDRAGKKMVFGVGKKPGAINPDGIEVKIQNMSRRPQPQKTIDRESDDLVEMAYRTAAVAEVAKIKLPEEEGKKKIKDWVDWCEAMRKSAIELAEAAKAKDPTRVKNAAAKLNSSCNDCHKVFKDT